jgi:hypothetical protein
MYVALYTAIMMVRYVAHCIFIIVVSYVSPYIPL